MEIVLDSKHRYQVDGVNKRGVTSVLSTIGKPALINWAVKVGAEAVQKFFCQQVQNPGQDGFTLSYKDASKAIRMFKGEHTKISKKAATNGTEIHAEIEQYVKSRIAGEKLGTFDGESISIIAFREWERRNNVKFLFSEEKVYSSILDVCGTVDIIAEVNGKVSIVDIKTSRSIYPEYFLQLCAYKMLAEQTLFVQPAQVILFHVNGVDPAVAHCFDDPGTIKMGEDAFGACLYLTTVLESLSQIDAFARRSTDKKTTK